MPLPTGTKHLLGVSLRDKLSPNSEGITVKKDRSCGRHIYLHLKKFRVGTEDGEKVEETMDESREPDLTM
jgi:hypothetical protein